MQLSAPNPERSAFQLENVRKIYTSREGARITALENMSFNSPEGTVSCIVGPTGSGKSTVLRLFSGLEVPDAGHVAVAGDTPSAIEGNIGYLTQRHTLFPWLTVGENIGLPLDIQGRSRDSVQQRVLSLCETLGLKGTENLYPYELSGGMQQRTSLGRLLAAQASYWLLDEPFSSLDERTRHQMQKLLLQLVKQHGLSVLFVTHDIDEAVFLGDSILVLSSGPGRVIHAEEVRLAHRRNRLSPEYGEIIERIRKKIEITIEKGLPDL